MTTTTRSARTAELRATAAALRDAELALGQEDDGATHEALLALARASYRSLSNFERESPTRPTVVHTLHERLHSWRQELDEMRVQLALAEMEARDAGAELAETVERALDPASGRLSAAMKDIGQVLADVRRGLTERVP